MGIIGLDKLDNVLIEFVDSQLMPTAPSWMQFMLGGAVPVLISKKEELYNKILPLGKSLGIIDDQGRILIEKLQEFLENGFKKSNRMQIGSFVFTSTDGEALINIMRKYEG